jgi:hypothetical protein
VKKCSVLKRKHSKTVPTTGKVGFCFVCTQQYSELLKKTYLESNGF